MGLTCSGKTKLDKILSIQLKIPFFDGNNFHSQDNINKMKKGYPQMMKIDGPRNKKFIS